MFRRGNLGIQYCIKSREAYNRLKLIKCHVISDIQFTKFYASYWDNDQKARNRVKSLLNSSLMSRNSSTIYNIIAAWREE